MNAKSEWRIKLEEQGFSKQEIQKAYYKRYRKSNHDKVKAYSNSEKVKDRSISRHMHARYGITRDQYNTMIEEQGNKCKICGAYFGDRHTIHIDHCHTSGKVRGLLCANCNTALGQTKDSIDILQNMIEYLSNANR